MNENQFDQNSYLHHQDDAFQQHSIPDSTVEHHTLDNNSIAQNEDFSQSNWEQQNQVDHFQPSYDTIQNQETYSLNHSDSVLDGTQQNTFNEQGLEIFPFQEQNSSVWEQQYSDSTSQENNNFNNSYIETQNNHSGLEAANQMAFNDLSTHHFQIGNFEGLASHTQDHNSNLWEQQFQQRSGHAPTADDLNEAINLEHQAQEQEKMYENDTRWATNISEYFGNSDQAHIDHQNAAEHKQKAEDLQAEADKLRNQT